MKKNIVIKMFRAKEESWWVINEVKFTDIHRCD